MRYFIFIMIVLSASSCRHAGSRLSQSEFDHYQSCFIKPEMVDAPMRASEIYGSPNTTDPEFYPLVYSSAIISKLAYEPPNKIKKEVKKWGFSKVSFIEDKTMFAFVASNSNCSYLAFRGTELKQLGDLVVDARATKHNVGHGKMHKGFFFAYQSMKKKVRMALKSHRVSKKKIIVTGHSLGGALAGVFAYENNFGYLFGKGPSLSKVITFGQPVFTDTLLALKMQREFGESFVRVVNNKDVVTRVPWRYTHFGALLWMRDDVHEFFAPRIIYSSSHPDTRVSSTPDYVPPELPKELEPSEEAIEELMDLIAPQESPEHVYAIRSVSDHKMDNYIEKIKTKL